MTRVTGALLKRIALLLVGLAAVALLVTFEHVKHDSIDMLALIWLLTAFAVLVCVNGGLLWIMLKPLWRGAGFDDGERLFWIACIALPMCGGLLYAVIWSLMEAYAN